ncbi:TetR/AcrR family transcriptional regulator [Nocardia macrotermitis]|uniref:TetR/AcrR family transcriptional regulator n=1 Tax=Nocardia macrotermitis TaxID=2585198 RepID=UPI0029E7E0F0|nr:TetR family transcriptional regulator [Nocardia macrotermitis]
MTTTRPVIAANRRGKREQIIDAAKQVLARDGLAACTARSVAEASPLTKSAVHYYFDDIHELIDLAMREHVAAMAMALRGAAGAETDPAEKVWAVVDAYLRMFAEQPNAAFLWFEYWIDTGRRNSSEAVGATLGDMHVLLHEVLAELPVADAAATAHTVLSWLLGTVVQQQVQPKTPASLREEVTVILRSTTSPRTK